MLVTLSPYTYPGQSEGHPITARIVRRRGLDLGVHGARRYTSTAAGAVSADPGAPSGHVVSGLTDRYNLGRDPTRSAPKYRSNLVPVPSSYMLFLSAPNLISFDHVEGFS